LAGLAEHMEDKRNACRILVAKPEGKIPLGITRCGRKGNINIDLAGIGWNCIHWVNVVWDRENRWAVVKTNELRVS
jgi:hypothetical protein